MNRVDFSIIFHNLDDFTMAQVETVRLQVGIRTTIDGTEYRNININARLRFTEQEIGLQYKVSTALYSTDRQSDDADNPHPAILFPLWVEDLGTDKIQDIPTDSMTVAFSPLVRYEKMYRKITVTGPLMYFPVTAKVLNEKLDEDPGLVYRIDRFPNPGFEEARDELFARVILYAEGQSNVLVDFNA